MDRKDLQQGYSELCSRYEKVYQLLEYAQKRRILKKVTDRIGDVAVVDVDAFNRPIQAAFRNMQGGSHP